ncbi:MAG: AMP-binding protein, partial [Desulfosalsimonadaceae bacterium]|nr:AMP-binding protein [Desulfosalsimonadaceae bacterium]
MKYQDFKFFTKIPAYNDENDMTTGKLDFDDRKCKRCGICAFICPGRTIYRDPILSGWRNGLPRLMPSAKGITDCIACGCCVAACPEQAIRIERQFNPGYFFQRLTQTDRMTYPKSYSENDLPPAETGNAAGSVPYSGQKTAKKINWTYKRRQMALLYAAISAFIRVTWEEIREGRIIDDIRARRSGDTNDISWAQLLETRARRKPDKIFLNYKNGHADETFTFRQMDENANRVANFLLRHGGGKGKGLGIFMKNSPRFLDLFFGAQKIGMYLVPINPGLKGEGLSYLINHSDIESLALDAELIDSFQTAAGEAKNLRQVFIDDVESEAQGIPLPENMIPLSRAYAMPPENPGGGHNPDDMCLIIYTSGTTGRPKGVVYRYKKSSVKMLTFLAHVLLREDDVYYTCLPLCHGNALFVTTTMTLGRGASVALSRKFSASRFFETLSRTNATVFNTIGAIIPILMKQPEKESDRQHHVRVVFSAACPADMWRPFEKRFGVQLYEAYGAVDGGGKGIMNLGTAPVGSLGKPTNPKEIKIADGAGNPVPTGTAGELLFKLKEGRSSAVEYYKNTNATSEKSGDGWLHTGDLVRQDADGFIYFVGRNTESMRKGGENVSAYEVEHVIMEHPAVEEVAVYAV